MNLVHLPAVIAAVAFALCGWCIAAFAAAGKATFCDPDCRGSMEGKYWLLLGCHCSILYKFADALQALRRRSWDHFAQSVFFWGKVTIVQFKALFKLCLPAAVCAAVTTSQAAATLCRSYVK